MESKDQNGRIKGMVVVITGASSGIGEATAIHLASLGAHLCLGARRKEKLDHILSGIQESGGEAEVFVTDVTKRTDVESLIRNSIEHYGRVDVLINNAGIMPLSPLEERMYEDWDRMIDTNIKGVLYGIGAVLPHMKERRAGHIVNMASVAGHRVPIGGGSAVYSATKFAVRAISEGLRQEVKPYNIRTTIISPGAIRTELPQTVTDARIKAALQKSIFDIAIAPDSVARAVAFALEQPDDVDINEILLRPSSQVS